MSYVFINHLSSDILIIHSHKFPAEYMNELQILCDSLDFKYFISTKNAHAVTKFVYRYLFPQRFLNTIVCDVSCTPFLEFLK